MTKIGFTRLNLQIYNSKSDYFVEEGVYFDEFWGRGRILTQSSVKNLKFSTFFQRCTAFMADFWAIFWNKASLDRKSGFTRQEGVALQQNPFKKL